LRQLFKKPLNFLSTLKNLIQLMKDLSKSRKAKPPFEINWDIREFFSDAALTSFCDEIENKNFSFKKN
jgi:hypothetical protein